MNTKERIVEGIVIGVTAGLILGLVQWALRSYEDHNIRASQLEEIRGTLYHLVDEADDEEYEMAAQNFGTSHALVISEAISTLLSFDSSHLTSRERKSLHASVATLNLLQFKQDATRSAAAVGAVCLIMDEFEFEAHRKCDEHIRRMRSMMRIEIESDVAP